MDQPVMKKLPLAEMFDCTNKCVLLNLKSVIAFSIVNFFILLAGVYSWKTIVFLPLLVTGYIFWCFFFRYYFRRYPYFDGRIIFQSTVSSTKILFFSMILVTIIVVLPIVPLFLGLPLEMTEKYQRFLQKYMLESDWLDLGLNLLVTLLSPYIIYRPFLAWISSLLGRADSIHEAWKKTAGNYWQFLMLALIFNLGFVLIQQITEYFNAPLFVLLFVISPLVVYCNMVLARIYQFFFL